MRINRDTLLKLARETVSQRTRADRGIMAAFLHGSLLEDEYLAGGTTDIDLFFVHNDAPPLGREIIPLSDDVHLDIAHHQHRDYRNTRLLRVHPWLGPTLKDSRILYDPQHFLDFTQASVRGQFDQPDHVLERSRKLFDSARQTWLSLHDSRRSPGTKDLQAYFKALENAANAIAGLYGEPLTERRFLLNLPPRFELAGKPKLYPALLGLIGAQKADPEIVKSWMPLWQTAYQAVPSENAPVRLHPARIGYYQKAIEAFLGGNKPIIALWPLLDSWTRAVACLERDSEPVAAWQASLESLDLVGKGFAERLAGLDAFLDLVDETLEEWADASGASLA